MPRTTEILTIDAQQPDPAIIARAAEVLRRGGLVAFPTETVYGLGANALDEQAVRGIFDAKGRPAYNPVIVHVASRQQAAAIVADWTAAAERLAERFWPGPLSLVLPKRSSVPDVTTAGAATVAVRVPDHAVALALIEAAGVPVAAPSANRSMAVSPTRAEHVLKDLKGRIDLLLDGGPTRGGLESTVVDLSRGIPRLLRPGLVTAEQIEAAVGPLDRHLETITADDMPLPSPGMMTRHYAPQAILEIVAGDGFARVVALQRCGIRVGWLALGDEPPPSRAAIGAPVVVLPGDPAGYSAGLYAALHRLDELGVQRIVVAQPPSVPAWLAVHDRLRRASSPA